MSLPEPKRRLERLRSETRQLQKEARERTLGFIVASFSLVAGLAWNDAVKALIEELFPSGGNTLQAKFLYAGVVTLAVVLVSVYLTRILKEREKSEDKKDI